MYTKKKQILSAINVARAIQKGRKKSAKSVTVGQVNQILIQRGHTHTDPSRIAHYLI